MIWWSPRKETAKSNDEELFMLVYHGSETLPGGTARIAGARTEPEGQPGTPLRQARTCYNHLAGIAGVGLLDEMLRRGWLASLTEGERPAFELTPLGALALAERGVDLSALQHSGRRLAYGCPDWTEGRPHLAGSLASAILASLIAAGIIEPEPHSRAVRQSQPVSVWLDRHLTAL